MTVNGTIITGSVEIFRCKNVKLISRVSIPTFQIDICERISIIFDKQEEFQHMLSITTKDLSIKFGDQPSYHVPANPEEVKDWEWKDVQFRTRFVNGAADLSTEPVIRSDRGYILPNAQERLLEIKKMKDLLSKSATELKKLEDLKQSGQKVRQHSFFFFL